MNWFKNAGYAECNKFIEDLIKNHIDYFKTEPGDDNDPPSVKLWVQISTFLALKL